MSTLRSHIVGCGSYLPARIVTNAELAERVDTTDDWIVQRTGIRQRHVAADDEPTSILGLKAAQAALADAGMDASEIDMIIVATATPDHTFPATATQIQAALGITGGAAFDLQAVCSGFVFALATADKFLSTGSAKAALVIGAETFSRILDWEDRTTCVLFGDGAGAVVMKAMPGEGTLADRGVLATHIRSDGRYKDKLYVDGGAGSTKTVGFLRMEGKEVFRHAVTNLAETVRHTFAETGLSGADIDWFVPHQANRRIIDATADKLGISHEAEAHRDGRIKPGQLVLIEAMGGGFTWGSALIRW